MNVRDVPSPNFGPRRDGLKPELVVLHYTAMESAAAALGRLCDPAAEVSAHYLVDLDGTVWRLVPEAARAWHAGAGSWQGRGDVNSRSVGIELQNRGDHPFPAPQMAALERLLRDVMGRWRIPPEGVIGHADMAPGRKQDPGPRFDWRRLAREGLAIWPEAAAVADGTAAIDADMSPEEAFQAAAAAFGYPRDARLSDILRVFRQRFRPAAGSAPLDAHDLSLIGALAARWGVDPGAAGT
ncbi:MAG: N-acetylmuramoyl-L-alanine amidase [Alphaproteobacteria bacterium]|nr:MAG: N-acetylmuramoyl-L-alanine amidase [Alphaproteobacteria bacterium]